MQGLPPMNPSAPEICHDDVNWGIYIHPSVFRRHTHAFGLLRSLRRNGVLQYVHTLVRNTGEERAVQAVAVPNACGGEASGLLGPRGSDAFAAKDAESSSSFATNGSAASSGVLPNRRGGFEGASEAVAAALVDGEVNEAAVRYLFSQTIRAAHPQLVSYDVTVSPARPSPRGAAEPSLQSWASEMARRERNVFETLVSDGRSLAELAGFGEKEQKELRWWGEHSEGKLFFGVLQDFMHSCRRVAPAPLHAFEAFDPQQQQAEEKTGAAASASASTHQRSLSEVKMRVSSAYSTTVTEQVLGGMEGTGHHHSPFLTGLEVAIGSMHVGDTAEFFIGPDASFRYATAGSGSGPPPPPPPPQPPGSPRRHPGRPASPQDTSDTSLEAGRNSDASQHDMQRPGGGTPTMLFQHLQSLVAHGHTGVLHFSIRLRERLPLVRPVAPSQLLSQYLLHSSRLQPLPEAHVLSSRQEERSGPAAQYNRVKPYNTTNPFIFWAHSNLCQQVPHCTYTQWVMSTRHGGTGPPPPTGPSPSGATSRRPSWQQPTAAPAAGSPAALLHKMRLCLLRGDQRPGGVALGTGPRGVDASLRVALLTAILYEMGSLSGYEGRGVEVSALEFGQAMVYAYHYHTLSQALRQLLNQTMREADRFRKTSSHGPHTHSPSGLSAASIATRRNELVRSNIRAAQRWMKSYSCNPRHGGPPITFELAAINPLNRALMEFPKLTVSIPEHYVIPGGDAADTTFPCFSNSVSLTDLLSDRPGSPAPLAAPQKTLPPVDSLEDIPHLASTLTPVPAPAPAPAPARPTSTPTAAASLDNRLPSQVLCASPVSPPPRAARPPNASAATPVLPSFAFAGPAAASGGFGETSTAISHGSALLPCWLDAALQSCPFQTVSKLLLRHQHTFDDEIFFSVVLHELRAEALSVLQQVEVTVAGMERAHCSRRSMEVMAAAGSEAGTARKDGADAPEAEAAADDRAGLRSVSTLFETMDKAGPVRTLFAAQYVSPPPDRAGDEDPMDEEESRAGQSVGLTPSYPRHVLNLKPQGTTGFQILQQTPSEATSFLYFQAKELGADRRYQRAEELAFRLTLEMGKLPPRLLERQRPPLHSTLHGLEDLWSSRPGSPTPRGALPPSPVIQAQPRATPSVGSKTPISPAAPAGLPAEAAETRSPEPEVFFWSSPEGCVQRVEQQLEDAGALLHYYGLHSTAALGASGSFLDGAEGGAGGPNASSSRGGGGGGIIPVGHHLQPLRPEPMQERLRCCTRHLSAGVARLPSLLLGIPAVAPEGAGGGTAHRRGASVASEAQHSVGSREDSAADCSVPSLHGVAEQAAFYPSPFALSPPLRRHHVLRRILCKAIQKAFQCVFLLTFNVDERLAVPDSNMGTTLCSWRMRGLQALLEAAGVADSAVPASSTSAGAAPGDAAAPFPSHLLEALLSHAGGVNAVAPQLSTEELVGSRERSRRYELLGAAFATAAMAMEELHDGFVSMHGYDAATAALLYLPHVPSLWWLRARFAVRLGYPLWAREDLDVAVELDKILRGAGADNNISGREGGEVPLALSPAALVQLKQQAADVAEYLDGAEDPNASPFL